MEETRRRTKRIVIVVVIILALLVAAPAGWFTYTRFMTERYSISMDWDTITHEGDTYHPLGERYKTDADVQAGLADMNGRIGKTIGIAVFPKRSLTDLIWPVWVMEYNGDGAHRLIFVRGLMDVGSVYIRQQ